MSNNNVAWTQLRYQRFLRRNMDQTMSDDKAVLTPNPALVAFLQTLSDQMMSNDKTVVTPPDEGREIVVKLDTALSIADARTLSEKLSKVLEAKRACVFNASQVEMLDTAVLQLLVAFVRESRHQGTAVRWESPSAALCKAAALLDLEGHLELTATAEGTAAAACRRG